MKNGMIAVLALASGAVSAGPAGNWLEFDYGQAEFADERPTEDGKLMRIVGQTVGQQGSLIRYDLRRETLDVSVTTPADLGWERERDLAAVSFGRVVPMGGSILMNGEIGYGQVKQQAGAVLVDESGAAPVYGIVQFERKESTPLARLGFHGDHGGFTWTLEGEYLHEVPPPTPEALGAEDESETWWHGRIGYDIGRSWNIGLRYSDTEEITTTALSLRWRQ